MKEVFKFTDESLQSSFVLSVGSNTDETDLITNLVKDEKVMSDDWKFG